MGRTATKMVHLWQWFWNWFAIHTGTYNEPGPYYGFWSGFGSVWVQPTLIGGLLIYFYHTNCHVKGCKRFKTYKFTDKATGNEYKLCKRHHPTHNTELTHHHVLRMHKKNTDSTYEY